MIFGIDVFGLGVLELYVDIVSRMVIKSNLKNIWNFFFDEIWLVVVMVVGLYYILFVGVFVGFVDGLFFLCGLLFGLCINVNVL